jgi:hypothetical protein
MLTSFLRHLVTIPGVFFGYKLLPGADWKGEFYCVPLDDFANMDFTKRGWITDVTVQNML